MPVKKGSSVVKWLGYKALCTTEELLGEHTRKSGQREAVDWKGFLVLVFPQDIFLLNPFSCPPLENLMPQSSRQKILIWCSPGRWLFSPWKQNRAERESEYKIQDMKAEASSGSPVFAAEPWPAFQCSSLSLKLFPLPHPKVKCLFQKGKMTAQK